MSISVDFVMQMREQVGAGSVTRFEPYENRRTKTIFTRCLGLAEAFIEIDGPIYAWGLDRHGGGFIVWMGRLSLNMSWTAGHVKLARVAGLGLVVDAAFHLAGYHHWGPAQPLEYIAWVAMAKRYIV